MSKAWSLLRDDSPPRADHINAWLHDTPVDNTEVNTASSWAAASSAPSARPSSHAGGWASLDKSAPDSDSDDDVTSVIPAQYLAIAALADVEQQIAAINGATTMGQLSKTTSQLNVVLVAAQTRNEVAYCALAYDAVLTRIAIAGQHEDFLEGELDTETIQKFADEQLRSTDSANPKSLESHTAEAQRLAVTRKVLSRRRALASVSAIMLQHACADAFLDGFCARTESNKGSCEVYYERHKGR